MIVAARADHLAYGGDEMGAKMFNYFAFGVAWTVVAISTTSEAQDATVSPISPKAIGRESESLTVQDWQLAGAIEQLDIASRLFTRLAANSREALDMSNAEDFVIDYCVELEQLTNTADPEGMLQPLATQAFYEVRDLSLGVARTEGVLRSADSVSLRNRTGGDAVIVYLVPDNQHVEKGELIVELDSTSVLEERAIQEIVVASAKLAFEWEQEVIQNAKLKFKEQSELATQRMHLAKLARKRFTSEGGEYELKLGEIEQAIAEAKIGLRRANAEVRIQENREQADSDAFDAAKETVSEREAYLKQLQKQRRLWSDFIRPHRLAELDLADRQTEVELELLKREFKLQQSIATARLESLKTAFEQANDKLTDIQTRLNSCRIYAPRDGMVAYQQYSNWDGIIEEGQTINSNMTIAQIVSMDKLELKALVTDSQKRRIQAGQAAEVRFLAEPDRLYRGLVSHVDQRVEIGWRRDQSRKYVVLVTLSNPVKRAKLGMKAQVTIETSGDDSAAESSGAR